MERRIERAVTGAGVGGRRRRREWGTTLERDDDDDVRAGGGGAPCAVRFSRISSITVVFVFRFSFLFV